MSAPTAATLATYRSRSPSWSASAQAAPTLTAGYVEETAATFIAVEPVRADAGEIEIGVTVAVVVAEPGADGVTTVDTGIRYRGQAAARRLVERAVAVRAGTGDVDRHRAVAEDVGSGDPRAVGRRRLRPVFSGPAGGAARRCEAGRRSACLVELGRCLRGAADLLAKRPEHCCVTSHLTVFHPRENAGARGFERLEAQQHVARLRLFSGLPQKGCQAVAGRLMVRDFLQRLFEVLAGRHRVSIHNEDAELVMRVGVFRAQEHTQGVVRIGVIGNLVDDPFQFLLGTGISLVALRVQQGDAQVQTTRDPVGRHPCDLLECLDRLDGAVLVHQRHALVEGADDPVDELGGDLLRGLNRCRRGFGAVGPCRGGWF